MRINTGMGTGTCHGGGVVWNEDRNDWSLLGEIRKTYDVILLPITQ